MTNTPDPIYVDCQRPLDEQFTPEQLEAFKQFAVTSDQCVVADLLVLANLTRTYGAAADAAVDRVGDNADEWRRIAEHLAAWCAAGFRDKDAVIKSIEEDLDDMGWTQCAQ